MNTAKFNWYIIKPQVSSHSALSDTIARKLLPDNTTVEVSSTELHQGETIKVIAGDIILISTSSFFVGCCLWFSEASYSSD